MNKRAGLLLILVSIVSIIWISFSYFRVAYWIKPPKEKLEITMTEDFRNLEKAHSLPSAWKDIKEVKIRGDNSPVQEWIPKFRIPVSRNPNGKYCLEMFLIHWIEGSRYGVVVQYNLVDLTDNNTIWELNRTYKLGFIY